MRLLAQELMDAEMTHLVGAGLHERSENRLTYRNGYREREWDTRVPRIHGVEPARRREPPDHEPAESAGNVDRLGEELEG